MDVPAGQIKRVTVTATIKDPAGQITSKTIETTTYQKGKPPLRTYEIQDGQGNTLERKEE